MGRIWLKVNLGGSSYDLAYRDEVPGGKIFEYSNRSIRLLTYPYELYITTIGPFEALKLFNFVVL